MSHKLERGEEDEEAKDVSNKPSKPSRRPRTEDETAADEKSGSPGRGADVKESPASKGRNRGGAPKVVAGGGGGGWMDAPSRGGGRNSANKIQLENDDDDDDEAENNNTSNKNHFNEDDDGIVLIPDLDEDGDGGGGAGDNRVAQAPRNVHRKIPTLAELENDVKSNIVANSDDGYDLGILLGTLVPASQLSEVDATWDFDKLLREVTDELTNTPKTVISATISSSVVNATNKEKEKKSSKKKR